MAARWKRAGGLALAKFAPDAHQVLRVERFFSWALQRA
jgi:hypothetical protein